MLAKAKAAHVAKHAALSAPNIFLPRLLLCCGLPSESFYTILSRLDQLGEKSPDVGKAFEEMISPGLPGSGSHRISKQKLYGRILAYFRIYRNHAAGGEIQELVTAEKSLFVTWLSSEISGIEETRSMHSKRQGPTGIAIDLKSCLLDSFSADTSEDLMVEEDEADTIGDIWLKDVCNEPLAPNDTISPDFVRACIIDRQAVLEQSLSLITSKCMHSKEMEAGAEAAKALLAMFPSFHNDAGFIRIVMKWVPIMTQDRGEDGLWELIFLKSTKQKEGICHLMSLVSECALNWSDEHISACHKWISIWPLEKNICSLELVLRFLVVSSEQKDVHCFDSNDNTDLKRPYPQSQDFAIAFTKLALQYVDLKGIGDEWVKKEIDSLNRRNTLPDWLTLIMLVGCNSHQAVVTRLVLEKIDGMESSLALASVLLRLYVMSPLKMNLSDSKLRNALLHASNSHLPAWLDWRCPLDCQVSEMLSNLTKPHQQLVQSVVDIARQHPIVFVRHLNAINQKLMEDGSGRDSKQQVLVKRGRIFGKHTDAVAKIGDLEVKVTVVLWGQSFNEPVWTSVLDALMTLPVEVAFKCGTKLGLMDILEAYLMLFAVHIGEMNAESNVINLREKFVKLIEAFRKFDSKAFDDWVQRGVCASGSNVRYLLSVASVVV